MYERTTAYYNWILDNTKDATYCNNPSWIKEEISTTELITKTIPSEPSNKPIEEEKHVTTELNQESIANINFKFNVIDELFFIYLQLLAWQL